MNKPFFLVVLCLTAATPYEGYCEEPSAPPRQEVPPQETAGSDSSFDPRLPPVLPGEEVSDSGERMKVWSTAGDPSGRKDESTSSVPSSIIIDTRNTHRPR